MSLRGALCFVTKRLASGKIRALPYTGGLATPWQRHQTPFLPLYPTIYVFLGWSGVTVIKIGHGPVRKDPSLLVRGDGGFWVVCFLETLALAQ